MKLGNRARALLIELDSLKGCDIEANCIGTMALLNEVLRSAHSLANSAIDSEMPKTDREAYLENLTQRSLAAQARATEARNKVNAAMLKAMRVTSEIKSIR